MHILRVIPLVPVVLSMFISGCSTPQNDTIDRRIGELRMRQDPSGAQIAPLFIDPATPIAEADHDSTLPPIRPATFRVGDCTVYLANDCQGTCLQHPAPVDGGRIEVTGLPQPVSASFHAALGGSYDELAFAQGFMTEGARVGVHAAGSAHVPSFSTELTLPMAIHPTTTLDHGVAGGLDVSWTSAGDGTRVRAVLSVTPADGRVMSVACDVEDAAQHLQLPAEARDYLPPAPRQLALEVSRYRQVDVPLGDGRGVVVYAGNTVAFSAHED